MNAACKFVLPIICVATAFFLLDIRYCVGQNINVLNEFSIRDDSEGSLRGDFVVYIATNNVGVLTVNSKEVNGCFFSIPNLSVSETSQLCFVACSDTLKIPLNRYVCSNSFVSISISIYPLSANCNVTVNHSKWGDKCRHAVNSHAFESSCLCLNVFISSSSRYTVPDYERACEGKMIDVVKTINR